MLSIQLLDFSKAWTGKTKQNLIPKVYILTTSIWHPPQYKISASISGYFRARTLCLLPRLATQFIIEKNLLFIYLPSRDGSILHRSLSTNATTCRNLNNLNVVHKTSVNFEHESFESPKVQNMEEISLMSLEKDLKTLEEMNLNALRRKSRVSDNLIRYFQRRPNKFRNWESRFIFLQPCEHLCYGKLFEVNVIREKRNVVILKWIKKLWFNFVEMHFIRFFVFWCLQLELFRELRNFKRCTFGLDSISILLL